MAKQGQTQHFNKPLEDSFGFSAIVHANGLLHLAGIVSIDEKADVVGPGDMSAQIARIYDIMEATLAKNGATLEHVVSEVMYTTDMAKLMEATPERAKRYEAYANPATTAVQVSALAFPEAMLEIQVMAQLDEGEWSPDVPSLGSPV
ncbi:MAG: RidA family protein [bacterium]|jgi:enamine deaminase RidA (YjgF/YER057c/UK114 family)|nr:RidA family protein [Gammaproteobacteria bacterium]HIL85005.1 RidA family protein [Pseudomonadales bacterium]